MPVTFFLLAAVVFTVLRLTADPVELFMDINATEAQRQVLFHELNLDKPLPVQFMLFMGDVLHEHGLFLVLPQGGATSR